MGAQNVNCAPKFPQNGPQFCILTHIFRQEGNCLSD